MSARSASRAWPPAAPTVWSTPPCTLKAKAHDARVHDGGTTFFEFLTTSPTRRIASDVAPLRLGQTHRIVTEQDQIVDVLLVTLVIKRPCHCRRRSSPPAGGSDARVNDDGTMRGSARGAASATSPWAKALSPGRPCARKSTRAATPTSAAVDGRRSKREVGHHERGISRRRRNCRDRPFAAYNGRDGSVVSAAVKSGASAASPAPAPANITLTGRALGDGGAKLPHRPWRRRRCP